MGRDKELFLIVTNPGLAGRKNMKSKLLMLPAVLVFCTVSIALADWNVGPGGNSMRNGQSSGPGPLDDTVLWEGGPFSHFPRQAAAEGNVYVVARTFDSGDNLHGTYLYALDVTTGSELWHTELPVPFPATDFRVQLLGINGGRVYAARSTNSSPSYLYALNANDGSILWQSEELITAYVSEGIVFAPDGDPIVGNYWSVRRINAEDGTTVWDCDRASPSSDGCGVAIYGDRCYCWQATGIEGPVVRVIDLTNGNHLYDGGMIGAGLTQQLGLLVGQDGTVYAPRSGGNPNTDSLAAFTDTGNELVEKWKVSLGYMPFSTFAVSPDSTVYSYDRSGHVIRLDPDDGSIVNTSEPILTASTSYRRAAVDADGILYITAAAWPDGMLYSFNPDLTLRWSAAFPQLGRSGPVLADGGILLIAGDLTDLIAYSTSAGIEENRLQCESGSLTLHIASPVTSTASIVIGGDPEELFLQIFDLSGRAVSETWSGSVSGEETITFDVSYLSAGAYVVRLTGRAGSAAGKMLVVN